VKRAKPIHHNSRAKSKQAAVVAQASFLAYMDAFWVLMLIALAAVPLALTLRNVKLGGPVSMGH
jgi:DHA2 family multidrug resistance protein